MNVLQLIMLFISGGFIFCIWGINRTLKQEGISSAIRKKVSTMLFILAIMVEVLLIILLAKMSI